MRFENQFHSIESIPYFVEQEHKHLNMENYILEICGSKNSRLISFPIFADFLMQATQFFLERKYHEHVVQTTSISSLNIHRTKTSNW